MALLLKGNLPIALPTTTKGEPGLFKPCLFILNHEPFFLNHMPATIVEGEVVPWAALFYYQYHHEQDDSIYGTGKMFSFILSRKHRYFTTCGNPRCVNAAHVRRVLRPEQGNGYHALYTRDLIKRLQGRIDLSEYKEKQAAWNHQRRGGDQAKMKIEQLRESISEMSEADIKARIEAIRASRRARKPTRPASKSTTTKQAPKKTDLLTLVKNMTPEQRAAFKKELLG